jgi:MoxR-like ATPase
MRSAQALAVLDGIDFVTPDLVHELVVPALAHRLVLDSEARFGGLSPEVVVQRAVDGVPAPG